MAEYILNTIRVLLLCSLIFWGVVLGAPEAGRETEPSHQITEPAESPTAAPAPAEKETPTETTKPETQPAAATEPPAERTYTEEELNMLALVIYQEAGADYCSDETRLMVGTVVMNRIADKRYPNTMYEVITQRAQYGRIHWTGIVWPQRANDPEETHAVERAYAIAERILQGERALPADVIYQSEYVQGEIVAQQDGHYFCR